MRGNAELRWCFLTGLWQALLLVWPILSGLICVQLALGLVVGLLEGWRLGDAAYFTFVTGLTIGYGDLVPVRGISRVLAVLIGFSGIILTGLIAAVGVRALQEVAEQASK